MAQASTDQKTIISEINLARVRGRTLKTTIMGVYNLLERRPDLLQDPKVKDVWVKAHAETLGDVLEFLETIQSRFSASSLF